MIDAAILALTLLLLAGWFRFACGLVLVARASHDYSGEVAAANRLRFPDVRAAAAACVRDRHHLARLTSDLAADCRMLRGLTSADGSATPEAAMERWMVSIHYRELTWRARVEGFFDLPRASSTIVRLAEVVAYFAQQVGQTSYRVADAPPER